MRSNTSWATWKRDRMKVLIKVALSASVLLWLVHIVSFSELEASIAKTSWTSLLCVWLVQTLLVLVQTARWRIIARRLGIDLGFLLAWQNIYIGQFFNQVFPSAIGGDAVRAWRLHRSSIPIQAAIASIALERIVALFAVPLIGFMGFGTLMRIVPPGSLRGALVVLTIGLTGGLVALLCFDRIPLPHALTKFKIVQFFRTLPIWARRVFFDWSSISKATLLSLVIHASIGLSFWFLAQGLGATNVRLFDLIILAPLVMLVTTVPISIGGWGVREGAMITAMSLIGVPASAALAISIEFGFVMILVGLPGGVFWLLDADSPRVLTSAS